MPVWHAVLLGIVQGLTEFLPISSTAHLILVQEWLGYTREQLKTSPVTVVIQLGTLLAVFAYFRADVGRMLAAVGCDVRERRVWASGSADGRLARWIVVGTVPGVVAGVLFKEPLKTHFYNGPAIAVVAVVFALLMAAAEWVAARRTAHREHGQVTLWDAILIGVFQALALMPGGSRSGCTITAGLFAGLSRPAAARFSFLLSLPIMLGAGLKELADWLKDVSRDPELQAAAGDEAVAMLVGTLVAAAVGYAAVAWLMQFLRRYSMMVFVVYRLLLAAAIVLWVRGGIG